MNSAENEDIFQDNEKDNDFSYDDDEDDDDDVRLHDDENGN